MSSDVSPSVAFLMGDCVLLWHARQRYLGSVAQSRIQDFTKGANFLQNDCCFHMYLSVSEKDSFRNILENFGGKFFVLG